MVGGAGRDAGHTIIGVFLVIQVKTEVFRRRDGTFFSVEASWHYAAE